MFTSGSAELIHFWSKQDDSSWMREIIFYYRNNCPGLFWAVQRAVWGSSVRPGALCVRSLQTQGGKLSNLRRNIHWKMPRIRRIPQDARHQLKYGEERRLSDPNIFCFSLFMLSWILSSSLSNKCSAVKLSLSCFGISWQSSRDLMGGIFSSLWWESFDVRHVLRF